MNQTMARGLALLLAAALFLGMMAGCADEQRDGLSQRVEFLWQQHPNPYPEENARRAAAEARTLLADHDDDIELHLYYQDRLRDYEPDSLEREYQRRLDRAPNDAVNIILEAHVRKSGVYLTQVMDAALERDSTTAEVLAFGAIAEMGDRPPDSLRAMELAERAITLHPGSYQAHLAKAMVERRFGSKDLALKHARIAGELNPWRYEPVALEASLMEDEGRRDEALALIEQFFASNPTHPAAYRKLARYYEQDEAWNKLFRLEMLISQAYPEDGYAFYHAAVAGKRAGDMDLVFDAWEKAAEFGFFDLDYAEQIFDADEQAEFEQNPRYGDLVAAFDSNREASREQRKQEALDRPLDVKLRNFEAFDLQGEKVDLRDLRGKIVVLDFWSSSERNHPLTVKRLKHLRERYPEVEVVSVSVMERYSKDKLLAGVAKAAQKQGIDWKVWVADDSLAERMRVNMLPVFAVVDEDGYARYRMQGYHAYVDELLGFMIEAAIQPRDVDSVEEAS